KVGVTARIDVAEWTQVHVHIKAQAVVAAAVAHAQPERRDLGLCNVDAGRILARIRSDAITFQQFYHRLLQAPHQGTHAEIATAQIQQGIDHDLPRAVIRDLSAAVGLEERDAVFHSREMLGLRCDTKRVDRRMLHLPEFVRCRGGASGREGLHIAPHCFVGCQSESANKGRGTPDFAGYRALPIRSEGRGIYILQVLLALLPRPSPLAPHPSSLIAPSPRPDDRKGRDKANRVARGRARAPYRSRSDSCFSCSCAIPPSSRRTRAHAAERFPRYSAPGAVRDVP